MATDMVTSPVTPKGSLSSDWAAAVTMLVAFMAIIGGVTFAILLMNALTPL